MNIVIEGQTEDGKSLEEFARLIEARRKYLNETTEQSVAACTITFLKSLRATTKVADVKKPFSGKVVEHGGLYLSFRSMGKGSKKRVPCLRRRGSDDRVEIGKMPLIILSKAVKSSNSKIFTWLRRSGKVYWLAATSLAQAEKWVKDLEKKRIKKYKGLAKHALGRLMNKVANTSGINDNVEMAASSVAEKNTNVLKQSSGFDSGSYSITLKDELRYAIDALSGGQADIGISLQKAMNSITHVIEKRAGVELERTPNIEFEK